MKKKVIIVVCICILIVLILATIFSIGKFGVINPFSSCFGMLEILFTDKQYTIVQEYPKIVVFSKGENGDKTAAEMLNEFMNARGFTELEDNRMGAQIFYSNDSITEIVSFSINKYYSKWEW